MSSKPKLRVLVADDHALTRAGIRCVIEERFNADFVEAADACEALERARSKSFDLILLDVTMPGRSGLDIIGDLKAAQPDTPVLVVSMHQEEQFAVRVLRAGASGYLNKSQLANELLSAVEKVLGGRRYVSETLAERLASNLSQPGQRGSHESLSEREFEVLRMLAAGKSGKEIAAELSLSFKTISTYRTRILQKLDLHNNAELTRYALEHHLIE